MNARQTLESIARSYPPSEQAEQLADVPRIADHISLVADRAGTNIDLLDLCDASRLSALLAFTPDRITEEGRYQAGIERTGHDWNEPEETDDGPAVLKKAD